MRTELRSFQNWIGDWTGKGTTRKNIPVNVHLAVRPRLAGEAVEITVESYSERTNKLVNGVVALVSPIPDKQLRMAACSTVHGPLVLETTPDDPDAVAFAGLNAAGQRVVVSLLQDGSDLLLTAQWKSDSASEDEPAGMTNFRLRRVMSDDE